VIAAAGLPAIDLREAVRKAPLTLEGIEALSPTDLAMAQEHWRVHMAAELASARVFAGLVPQLMAVGAAYEDIREVVDMAAQEVDHGLLSARVYAALGGEPRSPLPPLEPVPDHDGCSPIEVVLRNVISISCCGETLAVAVIGAERERATTRALREILTRILADEVGHARFGWRLLRDLAPALDGELRRRLSAYLVAIFERDMRVMKGALAGPTASWAALSVGAPDGELAWATFIETMTTVTVPGLERCGLKAEWALSKARERVLAQPAA
jgi:hypothetical protein